VKIGSGLLRLLAGALVVATSPVSAQETGSLIKRNRAAQIDEGNPNAPRITMEAFGACIVSRSKGRVAKFIDMRVGEPEYRDYIRALFDRSEDFCLSQGRLQFYDIHLRGALFQALYNSEFRNDGPTSFGAVTSSNYRALYPEILSPEARSAVALEQFGECVARADTPNVRELLRSLAGSARETALFGTLSPQFSACIPQGEKLAFSKIVLKGALAEGIYRLSKAALAAPAMPPPPAR
jgi:hypothetical protein